MMSEGDDAQVSSARDTSDPRHSTPHQSPQEHPIRFADVVLYDISVVRYPERAAESFTPTASSRAEMAKPLVTGQRMEVGLVLQIGVPNHEQPAWTIDCRLNGVFEISEGTSQESIDAFVESGTVLALMWPYARELVQSITTRMRVLPLVLATIALQPASPLMRAPQQDVIDSQK